MDDKDHPSIFIHLKGSCISALKPENVQRLTIEDDFLRKVYNQCRLNKVKKGYDRISRHETEILKKKKKHLRELFIGDLVFIEAGRIKKKD